MIQEPPSGSGRAVGTLILMYTTTDADVPEGEVKPVLILWFPERGLLAKKSLFTFSLLQGRESCAVYFSFYMAYIYWKVTEEKATI